MGLQAAAVSRPGGALCFEGAQRDEETLEPEGRQQPKSSRPCAVAQIPPFSPPHHFNLSDIAQGTVVPGLAWEKSRSGDNKQSVGLGILPP